MPIETHRLSDETKKSVDKPIIGESAFGLDIVTFSLLLKDFIRELDTDLQETQKSLAATEEKSPKFNNFLNKHLVFVERDLDYLRSKLDHPDQYFCLLEQMFNYVKNLERQQVLPVDICKNIYNEYNKDILPSHGFIEQGVKQPWGSRLIQGVLSAKAGNKQEE